MRAFDPNDYRKRVLAAVEKRGGIEHSDAFELYDIPLEEAERVADGEVRTRVDEVWAFWQKQRDHPKYRVLVGLLVDEHDDLSAPLLHASSRRIEAERVKQLRARRDSERFEMLDTAIERLVARYGGVPAGKLPGLEDIGKMSGLSPADIAARVRRHRILDEPAASEAAPVPEGVSPQRRQQIRKLLAEYERLIPGDPVPTLLVLLGLDYTKAHQTSEIRLRADALRARTRELPPGRIRVVLDELLVHISDLLESGGATVDDYRQAVIDDATDLLRPQLRAAVLVEDRLVAPDFDFLIGEGIAAGLDRTTVEAIIINLANELGTTVEGREHLAGPPVPVRATGGSGWGAGTSPGGFGPSSGTNRAAGGSTGGAPGRTGGGSRAGAAGESGWGANTSQGGRGPSGGSSRGPGASSGGSSGHGGPSTHGGPGSGGSAREWEEPLKAARAALRRGRPNEAAQHVDRAQRNLYGDSAGLTSVRSVSDQVDQVLKDAALRWRTATAACAGKRYMEAIEALEHLQRTASDVPNPATHGPTLDQLLAEARAALTEADRQLAAAPPTPPAVRMRALLAVLEICADHAGTAAALSTLAVDPPGRVTASRKPDGTVVITWTPSATEAPEYRVTRLQPDGSWRVVGRTRGTALEDGGATTGPLPVYGVVASVSGRASEVSRSDAPAPNPSGYTHPGRTTTGSGRPPSDSATSPSPRTSGPAPTGAHSAPTSPTSAYAPAGADRSGPAAGHPTDTSEPSGMPTIRNLVERAGLLTFEWPTGITEVMVVARPDAPPIDPKDSQARSWKVTNTRYQIDGGVKLPADLPHPCHVAIASCRRDPSGTLTVAAGFAPSARIRCLG
ncbi:hypothetical protein [Nocardia inohanensis]|uniref:hypothetical protein n=1 Tax=Nocardia inohanensis TaxID=209246 RepID=UPI00082B9B3E|nr:hypothetical protein [Nocardia inohanensis]